ncbi:MAG: hypothetical protein UU16_C0030G0004 [Candidatus Woesebacteria bacterium GW2011_GWA2_40_7]|uniref:Uncharacterized protein n=3 Tax=Candidatus Woeseibacteriota TaxID=1752722 RepID=A0A0G0PR93_9BACT|nr:MAG: hypothetical protein UT17_C0004G0249 [Candidatus Woesebacteria bacterium GW2011_GWB1_39_10]KKR73116.1 MAG: hypothetical protein UU16_C0030G0004 [Candidatus Woesebacteria bacterium GW2011_GWA2_40_7]KKS90892.1 MAG: hypothetical protein UV66_C0001G0249 [Candidatus Woesebacteria bacterium GW2011_GWA1_43_12]
MNQFAQTSKFLSRGFDLNLGKFSIPLAYWEVAAIVFLIFLLILSMAQFRRHYVDWGLKGALFGIFFGFLLALLLEGFLIVGGKTALTEFLGWKNAPKPLQIALDAGRTQLIQVLGVKSSIPSSLAKDSSTFQGALENIQTLSPADLKKVKSLICQP